jgi:hypothetical protein
MRLLKSIDIPQADRIEKVLQAIIAVSNGARTDLEIADQIPGLKGDARQGRYYRKSAQMLGFIQNNRNDANMTLTGNELVKSPGLQNPLFISSVLKLEVYQKLLPYLELHPEGVTKQQLITYLQSISDPLMGSSMIPRRISTILSWPQKMGFLVLSNDKKFTFKNSLNNDIPVFEINDIDQPLLPVTGQLSEYLEIAQRTAGAAEEVLYSRDQIKMERAINSHINLVNLVAKQVRDKGGMPKSNQLIDLAVRLDQDYIFEMKSTHEGNVRSQVRKGMSQLYEYRYLQNKPDAKLILVIEKPLENNNSWMLDFLENDRNIHLVWDGNNKLYATDITKTQLSFLNFS